MGLDGRVLTIATVNVNGIRAAFRRGMGDWLEARRPDVLLLQETRAGDEHLRDHLDPAIWDLAHAECEIKGRSGVAIASRLPIRAVRIGLDQGVATNSGRWVEADLELPDGGALTVVSTYVHAGTVDTPSMGEKYAFLELVTARMAELCAEGGRAVVGGDVNITHRSVDLKNWKGNLKAAGCLPEERAYLETWFDEHGWVDLGRRLGGEEPAEQAAERHGSPDDEPDGGVHPPEQRGRAEALPEADLRDVVDHDEEGGQDSADDQGRSRRHTGVGQGQGERGKGECRGPGQRGQGNRPALAHPMGDPVREHGA